MVSCTMVTNQENQNKIPFGLPFKIDFCRHAPDPMNWNLSLKTTLKGHSFYLHLIKLLSDMRCQNNKTKFSLSDFTFLGSQSYTSFVLAALVTLNMRH